MRCGRYSILLLCMMLLFSISYVAATDSSNLVEGALKGEGIVIVYFWDSACEDCGTSDEYMDDLDDFYGISIDIIKINLDNGETYLANLYDVEVLPTVVIYDELDRYLSDEPYIIIEGLKVFSYYTSKVDEALEYDDLLKGNADTFLTNANSYFTLEDYSMAKYYYENAKLKYDEIGDIFNSITCSQNIIKCDKYILANDSLLIADDYYDEGSYTLARGAYLSALDEYEILSDDTKVLYCNSQIERCELYPAAKSSFDDANLLISAGDYESALVLLNESRSDYIYLGETEYVEEIDSLKLKCNDLITAKQHYDEATNFLNEGQYEDAILKYQEAKTIYQSYDDSGKISICDQNIAIAQQFLDLQTPPPSSSEEQDSFSLNDKYLLYGGVALIIIILIFIIYIFSRGGGERKRNENDSAIDNILNQVVSKDKVQDPSNEEIDGISAVDQSPPQVETDSFMNFQDKAISTKNTLLVIFVQWLDEFLDDLDNYNAQDYFIYRERFDEVFSFFSRSFVGDETYLDQELFSIAKSRLNQIQSKLNDIMDVM